VNNARRKVIKEAIEALRKLDFEDVKQTVETIKDEEQEYFDNMPENMQGGDKGQAAEQATSALEEAFSYLEDAANNLEEAINALEGVE
jgi:hypothetical protein